MIEIPPRYGLRVLVAAIAGNEPTTSFIEVRPLDPIGELAFFGVRALDSVVSTAERLRERHELVAIGAAPRVRPSGRADAVERVWALRADVDSPEAVARLRGFRPLPSIVYPTRRPGHLHAWWALREAVPPEWARRGCRRIAAALGSDPAVADPARVMRAPSSFLRLELTVFTLGEVVGRLPDPQRRVVSTPASRIRSGSPGGLIAGLAAVVRAGKPGERNNRLNWAAFRAGEHAASGEVDPDVALDELLCAAMDAGLSESEATATIRSGLDAGAMRGAT